MAPVAFAVMQHNAAVSQPPLLLAGGAWHGRWAPAAPARPHPGPGLPLAETRSRFYLVMLLQLDGASEGPGHLAVRGEVLLGWPPAASPVGRSGMKGCPAVLMRGRGSRPAAADRNLISNRGTWATVGRGCGRTRPSGVRRPWCSLYWESQRLFVDHL